MPSLLGDSSSSNISIASPATLRVTKHFIPAHDHFPNSQATEKPLLIYHSAFHHQSDDATTSPSTSTNGRCIPPSAIESHLIATDVVVPQWRYTMYPTSHFHSTTHEVLVVTSGRARLLFGGESNPDSLTTEVGVGDVMILPAGVAHRLLEDLVDGVFEMVGSYPKGCDNWDMCYGQESERDKVEANITQLPWFERDPIFGQKGPVLDV